MSIDEKVAFLDNSMIEIKDMVLNNKIHLRNNLTKKILQERITLKTSQQERKAEKYADFDEKIKVRDDFMGTKIVFFVKLTYDFNLKNIENIIESEVLPEDELQKLFIQKSMLETGLQQWMKIFENRILEEDMCLEEKEIKEDNRLASM